MIRSLFAFAAAAWFGFNAIWYVGAGVYENEGASGGIDGEPGTLAVTFAARMLCVGLALASVALVDWDWVTHVPAALTASPDDETD